MSNTFNLRDRIEEQKKFYIDENGNLTKYWIDEGVPWAIQDYHSSRGSVMDFTENDWRACKDYGWSIHNVCDLCGELYFSPDVNSLEEFLRLYIEDWQSKGDDGMTGDQMADAIQDYFTWRGKILPNAEGCYPLDASFRNGYLAYPCCKKI